MMDMKALSGKICLIAVLSAILVSSVASAAVRDRQIDTARLCTKHFPKQERVHGIPTHLLAAISSVESGRWNDTVKMALPWPWTINASGKSYYLDSKAEAVKKAKALLLQGIRSVDVGCMQVNLKHHPKAFETLNDAFDPQRNVAYAAKFLRGNYDGASSWVQATASYHSKTPKYGKKYLSRIEGAWSKIVGRVRKARTKRGLAKGEYGMKVADRLREQQLEELEHEFANLESFSVTEEKVLQQAKVEDVKAEMAEKETKRATAKTPKSQTRMRVIELSGHNARSKQNVMVIRPQIADSKADDRPERRNRHLASVREDLFVMGGHSYSNANRASSYQPASAPAPTKVRRPNFVFVD